MHSFGVTGWASGCNFVFFGPKRCMLPKCCMMSIVCFTIDTTRVSRIAQCGAQHQNAAPCAFLCDARTITGLECGQRCQLHCAFFSMHFCVPPQDSRFHLLVLAAQVAAHSGFTLCFQIESSKAVLWALWSDSMVQPHDAINCVTERPLFWIQPKHWNWLCPKLAPLSLELWHSCTAEGWGLLCNFFCGQGKGSLEKQCATMNPP